MPRFLPRAAFGGTDARGVKFPEREPVTIELMFSVPARYGELLLRF